MGGNISIGRAGSHVVAETMGGDIEVGEIDGWVRATTMGGDIDVRMVGDPGRGRRDVRLDSRGGDVTLAVPDGLSMQIDVTLSFTKGSRQDYRIESDFPLTLSGSDQWDYRHDTPQKFLYGRAVVGDGQHRIKVETVNGNVRLIRGR